MKLPEYKNDAPLYSPEDPPPLESNKFVLLGFGLPVLFAVCVLLFLFTLFN